MINYQRWEKPYCFFFNCRDIHNHLSLITNWSSFKTLLGFMTWVGKYKHGFIRWLLITSRVLFKLISASTICCGNSPTKRWDTQGEYIIKMMSLVGPKGDGHRVLSAMPWTVLNSLPRSERIRIERYENQNRLYECIWRLINITVFHSGHNSEWDTSLMRPKRIFRYQINRKHMHLHFFPLHRNWGYQEYYWYTIDI